jgi:hypothetical protein
LRNPSRAPKIPVLLRQWVHFLSARQIAKTLSPEVVEMKLDIFENSLQLFVIGSDLDELSRGVHCSGSIHFPGGKFIEIYTWAYFRNCDYRQLFGIGYSHRSACA